MQQLTTLEKKALAALNASSRDNGHAFGILEATVWADRKQLGGLITSLQSKKAIYVYEPLKVDNRFVTQFVIESEYQDCSE